MFPQLHEREEEDGNEEMSTFLLASPLLRVYTNYILRVMRRSCDVRLGFNKADV